MSKLFVNQSIEIDAPVSKVWEVLTRGEYNAEWAKEFSSGGPQFHLDDNPAAQPFLQVTSVNLHFRQLRHLRWMP